MFFKGLIWTIVISLVLSVLAVFITREKVETDLVARSNSSLSQFNQGWTTIKAEGRDLTFTGESPLMAMRKSALDAVKNVKGVRVVADLTSQKPKAAPYQWSALRNETGIVLKGHVPSPELRADILEKTKLLSNGVAIDDQMELADGAPEEGWGNAIEFGLIHMDKLKTGTITIDENAVRIEGEAIDVKSYMILTDAFRGGENAPDGYILASNVSTPKVADFRWSVTRNDEGFVLEGYAPSAESREEIEAMVVDTADGASIDNRLKLASGEPGNWDDRITFAIDHLKALKSGEIHISNNGITVSGEASTNEDYDAMQKMETPAGVTLTRKVSRPVIAPFTWVASLGEEDLVLGGFVPDETSRKALLEKAGAIADGRKIIDEMDFASGVPDGWMDFTSFALENLGQMKTGKATLTNNELSLDGIVSGDAALNAINSANAPTGSKLTASVKLDPAIAEAAKVAEAIKAAEEDKATKAAEAAKAAEETKAAKAAEAAKNAPAETVAMDVCQNLLNDVLKQKKIGFKTARAELKADSQQVIDIVSASLRKCPLANVEIGGHTDSDGNDQMNRELSQKRAQSVKAALVKSGIGEWRMSAVGYGESKPLAANDTPEGKAQNRRIEFILKQ